MTYDFYKQVPKDLEQNLQYRLELRRRASDEGFRKALITACKHDTLFFFNAFAWVYEPRVMVDSRGNKLPHQIPFITWEHQDPVILTIKESLGIEDIGAEKSRGEGASWIACWLAMQEWLFDPLTAIGFVSKSEDSVDNPEDPDSLMWKVDWGLSKLPRWMAGPHMWKRNLADHTMRNLLNGSTITGYSATGDVASGGRKKWFLMDELAKFPRGPDEEAMASTQHVTKCRLVVSTPKGSAGAYYKFMHEPSSKVTITIDWRQNPTRNRGLYKFENGKPVAVNPINNPLPDNYKPPSQEILNLFSILRKRGFKLEGVLRSPWYDHECYRGGATPKNIAQELDRDYGGSMYRVFGAEFMEKCDESVRPPVLRGNISYNPETLEPEWHTVEDGPVLIWFSLDARQRPPRHSFVLGVDVSTGYGGSHTSNSTIEGLDLVTMEQVLEIAQNTVAPADWADLSIAVAKWLHNAYLAWEINGPGSAFTRRVDAMGYGNIYYRMVPDKRGSKKTKAVGWHTRTTTKEIMFEEALRTVKCGEIQVRSKALQQECGQYVRLGGKIVHEQASKSNDDAVVGESHGDRSIGFCVAVQAAKDRPITVAMKQEESEPPPNTLAARNKAYEDAQREEGDEWDDRSQYDLAQGRTTSGAARGRGASSGSDGSW